MNRILRIACSDTGWGIAARAAVWIGGLTCGVVWVAWLIVWMVD